jgi:hypothetical protein
MPPFNLTSSVGAFIQALQKQKIALGNVWFRIVSRPGLGVADKAKPIQTKNSQFTHGSFVCIRWRSELGRVSGGESTFSPQGRQCGGGPT